MKLLLIKDKKAFTLIELLVVVAIIGILAAVGVVAYNGYTSSAKTAAAKSNLKSFQKLVSAELIKCNTGLSENFLFYDVSAQKIGCPISSSFNAHTGIMNYFRFGPGSSMKNPFNTNELAWRHSISYTNDSDVGFINISTYLENIRIRSCFKTPCNDSKNNQALEIDVVE
jgi:type IV pilus assembly protein PilA